MPLVYVDTSLRDGAVAADFERKFTEEIARVLNKPIERIRVVLRTGVRLCFNGEKSQPSCLVHMYSIGVFGPDKNPAYTKDFLTFLTRELKLEKNRICLLYSPIEQHMSGYDPS